MPESRPVSPAELAAGRRAAALAEVLAAQAALIERLKALAGELVDLNQHEALEAAEEPLSHSLGVLVRAARAARGDRERFCELLSRSERDLAELSVSVSESAHKALLALVEGALQEEAR